MTQSLWQRWQIYQRERFPVVKHGVLIAAFSSACVGYSATLRANLSTDAPPVTPASFIIAFLSIFLFFLQLRIADEFKDAADDRQYRPYRPVPRGVIRLAELAWIGAIAGCVQLGLAIALGGSMVALLGGVWFYMALMTKEFFVPRWLKARPLLYMLSHMGIMPLMASYGLACDWQPSGETPTQLDWFLITSVFAGIAIELSRKIRAPQQEEAGVETYSAQWGLRSAAIAWLMAMWGFCLSSALAAWQIAAVVPVAAAIALFLAGAIVIIAQALVQPSPSKIKALETLTGIAVIIMYPLLGLLPLAQ